MNLITPTNIIFKKGLLRCSRGKTGAAQWSLLIKKSGFGSMFIHSANRSGSTV